MTATLVAATQTSINPYISRLVCGLIGWMMASSAYGLCITSHDAKLREGPSSKSKVTWEVSKYTPLIALKRQGRWIQVEDMDGEVHWVHSSSGSEKIRCLGIKTPIAKLRTSGNVQAPLADIRQVDRYTGFKRLDQIEDWHQVQAPWGTEYWVHESNIWKPAKVQNIGF